MKKYLSLILVSVLLFSCNDKESRKKMLPTPTGKSGEVAVFINQEQYKGELGLSLKKVLMAPNIGLPQEEPLFNVISLPLESFNSLSQRYRNIVFIKKSKSGKSNIKIEKDRWASPQSVITIYGPDYSSIQKQIEENKEKISGFFENAEYDIMMNYNQKHYQKGIARKLSKKFKITLDCPPGYSIDLDTTGFVWIAHETPTTSQGIFVYEQPYTSVELFNKDNIIAKRNEMLKMYVHGPSDGSYMTTEDMYDTYASTYDRGVGYTTELRGLWKLEKDFMGGPFVSYSCLDKERNRIVTVEGYVFAAKQKKRNYLRQVDAILRSLKFDADEYKGDK